MIRSKRHIRRLVTVLTLTAAVAAPVAQAGPQDIYLPPTAVVREDAPLVRADGPDGYQPQVRIVKDDPLLARGYGSEVRNRGTELVRTDGPDGYQPQLRGFQPAVTISADDGFDWSDAGAGIGIGIAASLLAAAVALGARGRILAHS